MPAYAAFLRAVNLGKNRRVSGADLKALFEGLGLDDVASFRTSGNVVFTTGKKAKLRERIETALEAELGYAVGVFLRTDREVLAIAGQEPFPAKQAEASEGKLQVALLPAKPRKTARDKVLALATDDDPLVFGERELYWLPKGGQMESELDLQAIERLIGPTTRRTMGTIEALGKKFFG